MIRNRKARHFSTLGGAHTTWAADARASMRCPKCGLPLWDGNERVHEPRDCDGKLAADGGARIVGDVE